MVSLPLPPIRPSLAPRPRISSSPSPPSSLSELSVPKSGPPLGQPGTLFVTQSSSERPGLGITDGRWWSISCVSAHRACSEAALAERVCSLVASVCPCCLGLPERVPEQPTTMRRRAHPIRKALTTTTDSWAQTPFVRTVVGRLDHKDSVENCADRHIPQKDDLCGYKR